MLKKIVPNCIKNVYRKVKRIIIKLSLKKKIIFKCSKKWFGNNYGGFYICPDIIIGKKEIIIYSAGVGFDISFDLDIINMFKNCKVYAFDPTPDSIDWICKQEIPENYKFFPFGIGYKNGEEKMFIHKNKNGIIEIAEMNNSSYDYSLNVKIKSLHDIVNENNHDFIDIIKLDIEGSEFSIIENLNFNNGKCGQFIIEFHKRFFKNGKTLLNKSIKILRNNGYYCFAIGKSGWEYSFINIEYYNKNIFA